MSGTTEGTPEWEVMVMAVEVAMAPPLAPKTFATLVPVRTIEQLRDALDAAGIDWRKAKAVRDGGTKG